MHSFILGALLLAEPSPVAPQDWLDRLRDAAMLPVATAAARETGVPETQIRSVLESLRRSRLPADEAWLVVDEEVREVRSGGPLDNFGAFVQSRLDAGLRGRALAEAIREEHRRRGIGRDDRPGNRDRDRGRDDTRPGQRPDQRDDKRGRAEERQDDNHDRRPAPSRDSTRKEPRP